jgi:hypothetical protein
MALWLTLEVLEKTGVFLSVTECWRELDEAAWTLPSFQLHFTKADKERHCKLTAQTAGYHGVHSITMPNATPLAAAAVAIASAPLATPFSINVDGGTMMYYCWSHSLGHNVAHTSPTAWVVVTSSWAAAAHCGACLPPPLRLSLPAD